MTINTSSLSPRWLVAALAALTLLLLAVSAQSALAASPGWKLVGATGPTNVPLTHSETQQVAVNATGGTFTLTFDGQSTDPIPYNVTPSAVQSALQALSSIGAAGGTVTVTGGPGGFGGTSPYTVVFGGSLADEDVGQMTADPGLLTTIIGSASATVSTPTNGGAGGNSTMLIYAINVGGASSAGTVTVNVTLPSGITTSAVPSGTGWSCTPASAGQQSFACTSTAAVAASLVAQPIVTPIVRAGSTPGTEVAHLSVSGGGATGTATYDEPITSSSTPAAAGVQAFIAGAFDADGNDETQAGAHPYSATTTFLVNTVRANNGRIVPAGDPRDVKVDLPPGFLGNPLAAPRCPIPGGTGECDSDTIIGTAGAFVSTFGSGPQGNALYNDTPTNGSPAEFAFKQATLNVPLIASVRSDADYGVSITSPNTAQAPFLIFGATVTVWGTPANSAHDSQRCVLVALCASSPVPSDALPAQSLLTNPTDCAAQAASPPLTTLHLNSWQDPGAFDSKSAVSPPVTGCDQVPFDPSVSVSPTSTAPDSPSGLGVDISVPQDGLSDPNGIATGSLKKAVVQLPDGVSVNPSSATGLEGCSDDQVAIGSLDASTCPDGSKIGSVRIDSPLLDVPLTGDVYLGSPLSVDPTSGKMLRLFIVAKSDRYGVTVKLPGSVVAEPNTGQLTATFDNNPQLPFTDLQVDFKGGSKGILAMPQTCGMQNTTATLTPWSSDTGVTKTVPVDVTGDCSNGFDPLFAAGMSSQQAGGSGSFALSFSRRDGEQYFKGLTATLPPGLLANVGSVPLCTSEQAAADACPAESRVGSADATAGSGDPFVLEKKGDVYLTEGYRGGAFGLLVHVPVEAGPFTGAFALPTVTVRQALFVDRHDAHVTVVSDDFPTIDAGIPLRIRSVTVSVDRPGFMVNPTSCAPKAVAASLTSTQGASAAVDAPFGVVGCADLPFKPVFAAASRGRLAFKQGAALKVHVGMPAGDANIASVETVLPKELPSRLIPTINNACVYDVFQADYTQCPADSFVGTVTASSPILDQPLHGPVYIVAPPNDVPRLEIVLLGQGKAAGVRVDLEGDVIVDIGDGRSKVTFNTVPDVPVTSFDLDLPTGPHSILDAPSNDLCKGPIRMFVRIGAQNGKVDEGYRPITVSDCPKIAKVKVVSAKSTSTGLRLRVLAPAEGRLVVSGASLKDVARTVNRKLTYSVNVPLTAKAKKALAKKGKLRTRPTVYFKPVNAAKASTVKTKTLTVKKHAAKKKPKKHTTKKTKR